MAKRRQSNPFSTINPHAAGIDIVRRITSSPSPPTVNPTPVRTFRTFSGDLHALADWLQAVGITTVAMESTGVSWIPVFEILEARGSRSCWSMPATSSTCPAARRTSMKRSGCGNCISTSSAWRLQAA